MRAVTEDHRFHRLTCEIAGNGRISKLYDGEDVTCALRRPPGHHACRDVAGDVRFSSNSAAAA